MTEVDLAYRTLAAEIVRNAYVDYVQALKMNDKGRAETCEKFFESQWCYELLEGKVDGTIFIKQGRKAAKWKSRLICEHISRR